MAGGASNGAPAASTSQILQNFQNPQGNGGAQAYGAGTPPTAQSVSQLQQVLQRLGAQQGGGQSPGMQLGQMGMNMARMGQAPPAGQMPMGHPMAPQQPMQGAQPPQMTGGMGMPQQQQMLPWQAMMR